MRLKNISARNLMGKTFDEVLAAVTVFCGRNFAGKTTRINAINLALARYVPGVAKKPNEVFERLATGNPLVVTGNTDCGKLLGATWSEKRGSVSMLATDDSKEFEIPPVAIDPNEFFALSWPERVRYLFAHSDLPDLKISALTNIITANVKNIKLEEGNTPETEAAIKQIAEFICNLGFEAGAKESVQDWLADVVIKVREQKLLADQNAKRFEQTLAGLIQTANVEHVPMDAEARLAMARAELDAANSEVARLKQVGIQLGEQIAEVEAVAAKLVDETEVQNRISKLLIERDTAAKVQPAGSEPVDATMPNPRPTDATALSSKNQLCSKSGAFNRAEEDAKRAVETIRKDIAAAKAHTNCPTCGHDISDKQNGIVQELTEKLARAEAALVLAKAANDFEANVYLEAIKLHDEATAAIKQWDTDNAAVTEGNRLARSAWNTKCSTWNNSQGQINQISADIATLTASISGNDAARAAAAKLPELRQKIEAVRDHYRTADGIVVEKSNTVTAADGAVKKLTQQRSDAASRARAQEASVTAKASAVVLKLASDMLAELQLTLVDKAVGPLLDRCNTLCRGILEVPLVIKDGELGMMRPTGFVSHKTMSGSERALAYCALSLGLAAGSPLKIVVLDELGKIDFLNKVNLVRRLFEMIRDGHIHQAILVDLDEMDFVNHLLKIIGVENLAPEVLEELSYGAYAEFRGNDDFKLVKLTANDL